MTEVGTSSDSHTQEFRIALFGPQVTHWTHEQLSELQSDLLRNTSFSFLITTLLRLRSFHSTLEEEAWIPNHLLEAGLDDLKGFAAGDHIPNPQNLSQTVLAPITILSQIVNLVGPTENNKEHDGCFKYQAAQGFCIGFLSAAALASSNDRAELEQNASNAVRLAFYVGAIIDAEDLSHAPADRAVAVSARWKTHSDRTYLETSLNLFPNAYVSCITDDRNLTVTLPDGDRHPFCARLNQDNIKSSTIGLHGCYHHLKHTHVAEALKKLCTANKEMRLPNADRLRLPLRSTADTQVINTGALHEIAIDLILCERAHWYQTVKRTMDDLSRDNVRLVPLGKGSVVPHSLSLYTRSLTDRLSPDDDLPYSGKDIEEVAVVGMACRFPRADSLEEFWQLLHSGETCIGKLPIERFNPANVNREPRLANFWGNFLRHPDEFDHLFFGVSGREAKSMDPQQRLALQVAYEALESSGYCSLPTQQKMVDVGCYLGVGSVDYEENVVSHDANAFSATGTLRAFISGRISHFFGWTGPSITLDTACSSSAVAIHTASKALLAGECSMALAGGVNVITSPHLYQNLSAASFLNPNGSSRAFDTDAGGYCRGEGAGILTLKLLSRAKADGDTILGVIAGSAVNQSSNSSPITVPDSLSQSSLYRRALSIGRIEPSEVTYVEAHGTGTQVGDPIEYESVRQALTGPWRADEVFLGSVKDNIGHTEAASGAAAIIKCILMMQHKTIPKQANFASLNPRITSSPLVTVPRVTQEWRSHRHVALINNYGAAGSNVAIALREYSNDLLTSGSHQRASATYPILLSAKSSKSLKLYINALKSYLPRVDTSLGALAYNISRRQNPSFVHRATFMANDTEVLASILNSSDKQHLGQTERTGKSPLVLCFGGQTGRTVTISRELYDACDLLRHYLNECDDICQTLGLPTIFPKIFHKEPVEDIVSLHCILLSVQISSARCWMDSGVEVDTVIGHSFGQLSALCLAGSISLEDTFRLVTGRSHLLRETWGPERGVMLSVDCDRDELYAVLSSLNETATCRVDIACYNGPRSFVLAGDTASMAKAEKACQSFKTARLHSTHAYHSYVADGILSELNTLAESINIQTPRFRVETCSTGGSWSRFTAREVVQHTRQPVYFAEAVERIAARLPSAVWLEAGSTSPIIAMTRRIVHKSGRIDTFIPIDLETADSTANLANATSELWKAGYAAHYWLFHRSSSHLYDNLHLPPYQFHESRHWIQYKPEAELPPKSAIKKPIIKADSLVSLIQDRSNAGEHLFSVNTTNAVFDLAGRGHAVAGQSLCPASMYLELATRCAMEILGRALEAGASPHIESLTMSAPLGLGGEREVFLHLHETAGSNWQFTVFSGTYEAKGTATGNTEHAKGRISLASLCDAFAENQMRLLQKFARRSSAERIINSPLATGMNGTLVYKLFSDVVDYASYYHGVKSVTALGHEAVGVVTVPAENPFGMEPGYCDPILLDNFLQVAGIHVNCLSNRKEDEVFMCTVIEEVIFSSPFITNKSDSRTWTVYTRYETTKGNMTNDVFVYEADSKELVLIIMGANFRSVPFKSLVRSLTRLNIATTDANKPSDSDRYSTEDSGYQSSLHTPPDEKFKKQTLTHSSLSARSMTASLSIRPQPPLTKPAKSVSIIQLVCQMLSDIIEIPVKSIGPTSTLDDLGIDSLLATEVLAEIKKRFQATVTQDQMQDCDNVFSLCQVIQPDEIIGDGPGSVDKVQETRDATANFSNTHIATAIQETRDATANFSNTHTATASRSHHSDMEYQGEVKDKLATMSRDCFDQAKSSYDDHARTVGFTNFCTEVYQLQSELVLQYIVACFASLRCDLRAMKSGDAIPTIQHSPAHQKLVRHLYGILEAEGLIAKQDKMTFYRTAKRIPTRSAADLHAEMLERFPKHASETKLLHTTAPRLAECLSGAADPLGLIFRDSSARALMEDVYTNAPMFKTGTLLLAEYLSSILERFNDNREVQILELGAGTGGTTKNLVKKLAAINTATRFSYTFTDLSSSLVGAARRKFAKWPFMQYTVLDIEKDPAPGFINAFDIIISTNCIHATKDLVHSTTNIRKMLRLDGVLCLVELTRNLFWFDLVFGLLEGWWLFNDGRQHALADERQWGRCLNAAGFEWVDWTDSASQESDILRVITASPLKMEQPTSIQMDVRDGERLDTRQSLVFKNVDGLNLQADLYYPSKAVDSGTSLPVALMIHGGGHVMLSRNDMRPEQTNMLLKNGFLPISIDYRLCPETTLLEGPMIDVVDALAWIRLNLSDLPLSRNDIRVDTELVVAVGWSTGGHLAMSLAWTSVSRGIRPPEAILAFYCPTDYEDPFWSKRNIPHGSNCTASDRSAGDEIDDDIWTAVNDRPITSYNIPAAKRAIGGWLASSDPRSRLALYMNWHGRTLHVLLNGLDKKLRKAPSAPSSADIAAISPLAQIRDMKYQTPTFIIHPRQDDLIPWQQAQRTWEALRAAGVDAELRILEDVRHLFDVERNWQKNMGARDAVRDGYEFLCKKVGLTFQT